MTKFTLMFLCALLWLNQATAQVRLSWNNRIEAPADYNAVVFRGESVVLEAALTQYGIALPIDGIATLYYAVAGTTNYTASAASISGNKLIALWTPALDSGAARYTFFLSANMSGGRIYRANGSITIQASPGAYPPIIVQTGPTLVSLQDGITAAGATNAVQGVAIASLQTGQASLTGQVNAANALAFAAGDQATLARNTANAAALTAGVARATGAYLAATQAVHTATLAGLSIASTGTYTIATGALARANEALARPVGTDTGTVSSLIAGFSATNKIRKLYGVNPVNFLEITNTSLRVGTADPSTAPFVGRFIRDAAFTYTYDMGFGAVTNEMIFTNGTYCVFEFDNPYFVCEAVVGGRDVQLYCIASGLEAVEVYCVDRSAGANPVFSAGVVNWIVGDFMALERISTAVEYNLENFQLKGTASTLLINGNLYEQYWDTNANTTAWRQL